TTHTAVTRTSPNIYTITGGVQPGNGQNLFHSFRAFNVGTGTTVSVQDPGVNNILMRVTGHTRSDLQGRLQVNGNANLFLLNPNGIVFGRNASLDVRGSFIATTAHAIRFGNQGVFSATAAATPSLLTVEPSAFLFGGRTGAIVNRSTAPAADASEIGTPLEVLTGLRVPSRQSLLLLGGVVNLEGGNLTALGGRVEVAGVAGRGAVALGQRGGLHLSVPEQLPRAEVQLTDAAINVVSGHLLIAAHSLALLRSELNADNLDAGVQMPGGNITIRAQDRLLLTDSNISSDAATSQGAGRIQVSADHAVDLTRSTISTTTSSRGGAGSIELVTGRLTLNQGLVSATTGGRGNAGQITIDAHDAVTLAASSISTSANFSETGGAAGDITIQTPVLAVDPLATIRAAAEGKGRGGNITITAGVVTLDGGNLANPADPTKDENLESISTETTATNGGDISLRGVDLLLLSRQGRISTSAGTAATGGNGGNITIDAQFIGANPFGNSDITANAFEGQGGQVNITTAGLFGITARPQLTPLSDITASSARGVQGEVNISPPEVDPSRGLAELPTNFTDASTQFPQTCRASATSTRSEFVITGRGGLPPSPADFGSSEAAVAEWAGLGEVPDQPSPAASNQIQGQQVAASPSLPQSLPVPAVEAQGWMVNASGQVRLVAQIPATAQPPMLPYPNAIPSSCRIRARAGAESIAG
ncbi:MAG TPA: filamentous hemagglutinin N-terminal domain-containing protein, partial [Coleofasciculaceae cyanobacterium]